MKLSKIAEILQGTLIGDDLNIDEISPLELKKKDALSMVFSKKALKNNDISMFKALVVTKGLEEFINIPCIVIEDSKFALIKLIDIFYPKDSIEYSISKQVDIDKSVKISKNVKIDSFVKIDKNSEIHEFSVISSNVTIGKNVKIGRNTYIYPNVSIYDDVIIGDNVIIHSGAVIGSDGFGYVNTSQGHYKIRQVGNVEIGDNVEIGSNTSIDRATFGSTIIGSGTKIDNLAQIAHNVKVGENSIIVAQAGIAGSTNIGKFVIVGGQAAIPDHVNIADGVILGARTGVIGDINEKGIYFGAPQQPHRDFMKNSAVLKHLYKMKKQLDSLMEDKEND